MNVGVPSSKVWTDVQKGNSKSEKTKIRKIYKMEGSQIYIGSTRTYDCGGNQMLIDNREAHIQAQPGKQKGYDLKLPVIEKGGADFTKICLCIYRYKWQCCRVHKTH